MYDRRLHETLYSSVEQIGQSAFYESIDYPADEALASAVEEGIAAVEQVRGKMRLSFVKPRFSCRMDEGPTVGAYRPPSIARDIDGEGIFMLAVPVQLLQSETSRYCGMSVFLFFPWV